MPAYLCGITVYRRPSFELTRREADVLEMRFMGLTVSNIAGKLGFPRRTVAFILCDALNKLGSDCLQVAWEVVYEYRVYPFWPAAKGTVTK